MSPSESLGFASQIARALSALHGAGILHRDLKPGNVMLRMDEQVALIDFGLAKHEALDFDITDTGLIFGTPHYMSPEQGHGQDLDPRSDLYSLGVMLFEMLTGHKPYTADNPMAIIYMHRNAPTPQIARVAVRSAAAARPAARQGGARSLQDAAECHAGHRRGARRLADQGRPGVSEALRFLAAPTPAEPGSMPPAPTGASCSSITPTARRKPPRAHWR